MSDGGHMMVPSIGQAILFSTRMAVSSASEKSGKAHITPPTWQKAKNNTSAMNRMLDRIRISLKTNFFVQSVCITTRRYVLSGHSLLSQASVMPGKQHRHFR